MKISCLLSVKLALQLVLGAAQQHEDLAVRFLHQLQDTEASSLQRSTDLCNLLVDVSCTAAEHPERGD